MRLKQFRLEHYGCFESVKLDFATEPGRITLVVAPNGAGKSVLRQAFEDLLFDIPLQSPMRFRHGYAGMALHAEAIAGDGVPFSFGWTRGAKPQRVTSDPTRFAALRGEITSQRLQLLFALDTAALRRGGTDLRGGATLAGALLAGTGELAPAKAVRAEIAARQQANWGPGKSKPPLNAALAALDANRKTARAAVQRPPQRQAAEHALDAVRADYASARQDHDTARTATRRLHRIELTRPHLDALAEAEDWLARHPDSPALPAGLDEQMAEARGTLARCQAARDQALKALAASESEATRIVRDEPAGAAADRLARLPGLLGEAEKTSKDIAARRTEWLAALSLVRIALRDIGADLPPESAGALVPQLAVMAEARAAITAHAGLRKAQDLATARVAKARCERAAAESEPAAAPPLPDGLPALLKEVRADRNPIQHAADVADAVRSSSAALREALSLVPGWRDGAEALRALAPPAETLFERLDTARAKATARLAACRDACARLATQRDDIASRLAALHAGTLPDGATIAAARALRDRGMRLLLRRLAGTPDAAAEEAYAEDEPLPLRYERQVRGADDLADRRMAELDRLQQAEQLARQATDLESAIAAAQQEHATAAGDAELTAAAWTAACTPLHLGAEATMAELRGLLAARLRTVAALRLAETAAGAAAQVEASHAGWSARLAGLLGLPGALPALLIHADALVARVQAAETAATRQQEKQAAARRETLAADTALTAAAADLARWEHDWAALLPRITRPDGERPAATTAALDGIASLDRHHREAAALVERIAAMQADLDQFAGTVAALAQELSEAAGEPMPVAQKLVDRWKLASGLASRWQQAQSNLAGSRTAATKAEAAFRAAHDELGAVVAKTGAGTAEEADLRIAAGRESARMMAMRDKAVDALREHGDGLSRAVLRADADAVPTERMAAERDGADTVAAEAQRRAETGAVTLSQHQQQLDAEASATLAVDSRAAHEAAATQYARRLEEQLVLQLAGSLLGQAMQAVEDSLGGSGLDRVDRSFAAVTGGAYGIARGEDTAEGEMLHAIARDRPNEPKTLDQLSEGTRDQLYLALRLVALRDHCAAAAPLPFIADDIFQTFDDARATAALRALVELSADLQVIVLTHHRHLRDLAGALPAGSVALLEL